MPAPPGGTDQRIGGRGQPDDGEDGAWVVESAHSGGIAGLGDVALGHHDHEDAKRHIIRKIARQETVSTR